MSKDIMNIKNEEELKEYLDECRIETSDTLQSVKADMISIKDFHDQDIFNVKSVEDLEGLDTVSIFYYMQAIQQLALNVHDEANKRLGHTAHRIESRLTHIPEVFDAIQIQSHWAEFNEHLEKNPTLKEEWDALCMGIKLTEDFD